MGWFRKKFEEAKHDIKDEFKHRASVKKAEKMAYRQAQLKEASSFGRKKAAYESQKKLKELKNPSPGYTFGGFAGPTTKHPTPSVGVADYLTGSSHKSNVGFTNILGESKRKRKGVRDELKGMGL